MAMTSDERERRRVRIMGETPPLADHRDQLQRSSTPSGERATRRQRNLGPMGAEQPGEAISSGV